MTKKRDSLRRREFLKKAAQAIATTTACAAVTPILARGAEAQRARRSRISYYCNGEIYVTEVGKQEGKPLTAGHWDFKPSWSKTGDMLVCFRRLKDDPDTLKWKTATFVIHTDGTGFHTLSDGTHTDFNPTWTRDGKNTPIWNRKNDATGGFYVMQSTVGGKPGQEVAAAPKNLPPLALGRRGVPAEKKSLARDLRQPTRTTPRPPVARVELAHAQRRTVPRQLSPRAWTAEAAQSAFTSFQGDAPTHTG
jgi:hypothetical protein